MSRIAVVTSHPLFASSGGHLVIANALVTALQEFGHEATVVLTPQNRFGRQGAAYLSTWLMDLGQAYDGRPVDQVISFRYPSYAIQHDSHVCWINHRMREYYDQWPRFSRSLSWRARTKERVRRALIHAADRYLLEDCVTQVYAQSHTIQARLARWGRLSAEVLHPPPPPRPYRCDRYGEYALVASRLTPLKRIHLVLEALRLPPAQMVRCVIVGDGESRDWLIGLTKEYGLENRVTFAGQVSETELLEHLANCRAVCFPTTEEDYGLVTVEAFAYRKAVITCMDSSGPTELVCNEKNGLVIEPTAKSLAIALARISEDSALAESFGVAGLRQVTAMTWQRAVDRLLLV